MFTEYGILMLSSALCSCRAVQVNIDFAKVSRNLVADPFSNRQGLPQSVVALTSELTSTRSLQVAG
jgi:hypothetical protein